MDSERLNLLPDAEGLARFRALQQAFAAQHRALFADGAHDRRPRRCVR